MKVSRLEAHDRLLHFKKDQGDIISQGASDCLKVNPLSLAIQDHSPYVYVYAHPRTLGIDEKLDLFKRGGYKDLSQVPEKAMFWQPRLAKPLAQTNSYLFRALSHSDILEICWLLPPEELWEQYETGKVTENEHVNWSIAEFIKNKKELEAPHPEDLPDKKIRQIYKEIAFSLKKPTFDFI